MAAPRKLCTTVSAIHSYGPGVYEVVLTSQKAIPRFRSGQFLHLALDPYDPTDHWPDSRVFSIASTPASRTELRILYSVKGSFTQRMQTELEPGKEVWVKLPYGEFRFESNPDTRIVLIAGGTGLSPFLSYLQENDFTENKVHLFYGVASPKYLVAKDTLDNIARQHKNFRIDVFIEHDGAEESGAHLGQLSLDTISTCLEDDTPSLYYLSGPPAMIRTFREGLISRGIASETIRVDDWD